MLRLTISGGAGGRGLVPQQAADALCLVSLSPAPPPLACVKLYVSDYGLLAGQPDAAFKTGNYLPNIQARKQAIAHSADEALMLNQWGRIASAAAGNVIVETGDGQWLTPALAEGALPGIMLAQLRQLPDSPIKQGQVTPAMLETARHIFICNSVMEIVAAHFEAADASPIEAATKGAPMARPTARRNGFLIFWLQDLTTPIHAAFQVNMVRAMQFAAIGVFNIGRVSQRIGGATHAALRACGFSLRNSHVLVS